MTANHPDKFKVRQYTQERAKSKEPPPSLEEVRRQLGWGLMEPQRDTKLQQQ